MKGKKSLAMPSESTSQMSYSDQDSWWKEWLKKRQTEHYISGENIQIGTSVLSVPWCEQFSENEAQGKLWAFWNRWCAHCTLQTFCNVHQKMFTNSLLCSLLWLNKQTNISILQGNNHKMLSHLESNFKHRLILVDIRFGNEGISPGWYIQF